MSNLLKTSTKKDINYLDISSDLMQLAEIKESYENLNISTFCKFQSEQILMNNASYSKRIYPANSFTEFIAEQK